MRQRVGRAEGVAELSDAQRELVRVVRRHPGIRVGEAASALHLAANTVSTLVTGLRSAGWLRRDSDPVDGRGALLFLTVDAEKRVAAWHDSRLVAVSQAVAAMENDDRDRIVQALPALRRVVALLEESV